MVRHCTCILAIKHDIHDEYYTNFSSCGKLLFMSVNLITIVEKLFHRSDLLDISLILQ